MNYKDVLLELAVKQTKLNILIGENIFLKGATCINVCDDCASFLVTDSFGKKINLITFNNIIKIEFDVEKETEAKQ